MLLLISHPTLTIDSPLLTDISKLIEVTNETKASFGFYSYYEQAIKDLLEYEHIQYFFDQTNSFYISRIYNCGEWTILQNDDIGNMSTVAHQRRYDAMKEIRTPEIQQVIDKIDELIQFLENHITNNQPIFAVN